MRSRLVVVILPIVIMLWLGTLILPGSVVAQSPTNTPTPTLLNGTFESGLSGWGPEGSQSNAEAHGGSYSLRLSGVTETASNWDVSNGFWFWAISTGGTTLLDVSYSTTNDCFQDQAIPMTWTLYYCPPSGAASNTIKFVGSSNIYIDDVNLGNVFTGTATVIYAPTQLDATQQVVDTWLKSNAATTNNDGEGKQDVGSSGSTPVVTTRTLIEFKAVSDLPTSISVASATLRLVVYNGAMATSSGDWSAYRVLQDWSETQATWNDYSTGNAWYTPGAGSSVDIDITAVGGVSVPATPVLYDVINVPISTATIDGWAAGTFSNYGLLLKADTEGSGVNNRVQFYERRYVTPRDRPALILTVNGATPTPTPTLAPVSVSTNYIRDGDFEIVQLIGSMWNMPDAEAVFLLVPGLLPPSYVPPQALPLWNALLTQGAGCASRGVMIMVNAPTQLHRSGIIAQDFQWPGGTMYISMLGKTGSGNTFGQVFLINEDTKTLYVVEKYFTNPTSGWARAHYAMNLGAGNYRFVVLGYRGDTALDWLLLDDISLRSGYWMDQCSGKAAPGLIPPQQSPDDPTPTLVTTPLAGSTPRSYWSTPTPSGTIVPTATLHYVTVVPPAIPTSTPNALQDILWPLYPKTLETGRVPWLFYQNASYEPVGGPLGTGYLRIAQGDRAWLHFDLRAEDTENIVGVKLWITRDSDYVLAIRDGRTGTYKSAVRINGAELWRRYDEIANPLGPVPDNMRIGIIYVTGRVESPVLEFQGVGPASRTFVLDAASTTSTAVQQFQGIINERAIMKQLVWSDFIAGIEELMPMSLPNIWPAIWMLDYGSTFYSTYEPQTATAAAAVAVTQYAQQTAGAQTAAAQMTQDAGNETTAVWGFTATAAAQGTATLTSPQRITATAYSYAATATRQAQFDRAVQTATAYWQQRTATIQAGQATVVAATQHAEATANAATTQQGYLLQTAMATYGAQLTSIAQTLGAPDLNATAQAAAQTQVAQIQATLNAQQTAIAQLTAQAQGTVFPTVTAVPIDQPQPVPTQPEPYWQAVCGRPPNSFNLAWWMDFEVCRALSWFAWSPVNTLEWTDLMTGMTQYEPFGTMAEVADVLKFLLNFTRSISWDTGIRCSSALPDDATLMQEAEGLLSGNFAFEVDGPVYSTECSVGTSAVLGSAITQGVCFTINLLCERGIYQWMQWLFNGSLLLLVWFYIQERWLEKATQA